MGQFAPRSLAHCTGQLGLGWAGALSPGGGARPMQMFISGLYLIPSPNCSPTPQHLRPYCVPGLGLVRSGSPPLGARPESPARGRGPPTPSCETIS